MNGPIATAQFWYNEWKELDVANERLLIENQRLREALEKSVSLQSHYASLLNMHDGGERIGFKNAEAWIARLEEV